MSIRREQVEQVIYYCNWCGKRIGKRFKKQWMLTHHDTKGEEFLPEHYCSQKCFDEKLKLFPIEKPLPTFKKDAFIGEPDPRNRLSDGPTHPSSYYRGDWRGR